MRRSKNAQNPNIYTSLDELRRLQFKAQGFSFLPRQPVNSLLTGKNVSKLRGRGLNFEEMRQYHLGDDIRTLDWKVTLRTGKPYVKVFTEERERNVFLMVDQRVSMFFGSTGKMKSVIAAEIAALIAWRIIGSTDRVGAIVFNDDDAITIRPRRSRHHVIQILSEIVAQNSQLKSGIVAESPDISLNRMFERLARLSSHDGLMIFIGDGHGWNDKSTQYLKTLRRHNEMIICNIKDPLEQQLPSMPQMVISDGRMQIRVSSAEASLQQKYRTDIEQQLSDFTRIARKYRVPLLPIDTMTPTDKQLRKALGVGRG